MVEKMIRLNDLLGYNLKIYQDSENFCFSLDSVLLAESVKIKKNTTKILEIGSGTGAVSLILSLKTKATIDAVEVQKSLYQLLKKSILYNNLEKQIIPYNVDIKEYFVEHKNNYYDKIICNPPFFGEKILNKINGKTIARHDISLTMEDIALISKKLLKNGGSLNIIYDSKRLFEVLEILTTNNLIAKKLTFIHSYSNKEASRFLLECVKNGNPGLKIEPPIIIYNDDGSFKEYYKRILEDRN